MSSNFLLHTSLLQKSMKKYVVCILILKDCISSWERDLGTKDRIQCMKKD